MFCTRCFFLYEICLQYLHFSSPQTRFFKTMTRIHCDVFENHLLPKCYNEYAFAHFNLHMRDIQLHKNICTCLLHTSLSYILSCYLLFQSRNFSAISSSFMEGDTEGGKLDICYYKIYSTLSLKRIFLLDILPQRISLPTTFYTFIVCT